MIYTITCLINPLCSLFLRGFKEKEILHHLLHIQHLEQNFHRIWGNFFCIMFYVLIPFNGLCKDLFLKCLYALKSDWSHNQWTVDPLLSCYLVISLHRPHHFWCYYECKIHADVTLWTKWGIGKNKKMYYWFFSQERIKSLLRYGRKAP